jgi:hypothetical protein
MNRPRQLVTYQRLIERGATWAEAMGSTDLGARPQVSHPE